MSKRQTKLSLKQKSLIADPDDIEYPEEEVKPLIISQADFIDLVKGILGEGIDIDETAITVLKDAVRKHIKSNIVIE